MSTFVKKVESYPYLVQVVIRLLAWIIVIPLWFIVAGLVSVIGWFFLKIGSTIDYYFGIPSLVEYVWDVREWWDCKKNIFAKKVN